MLIGDREFEVHALTKQSYKAWIDYVTGIAREKDDPIGRFLSHHCRNLSGNDRRDALVAFMASPGWKDPDQDAIDEASCTLAAARALAIYSLIPRPTWAETATLITDANKGELMAAVRSAANPTDDDIRRANQAMRDRINKAAAARETQAEGQ